MRTCAKRVHMAGAAGRQAGPTPITPPPCSGPAAIGTHLYMAMQHTRRARFILPWLHNPNLMHAPPLRTAPLLVPSMTSALPPCPAPTVSDAMSWLSESLTAAAVPTGPM